MRRKMMLWLLTVLCMCMFISANVFAANEFTGEECAGTHSYVWEKIDGSTKEICYCAVCGSKESPRLTIQASEFLLKKGTTFTAKGMAKFRKVHIRSVKSSNKKVVSVSSLAHVFLRLKAKKVGSAIVTIEYTGGITKDIKVKVQKGDVKAKSITEVPQKVTLTKGKTFQLNPRIVPDTCTEIKTYKSSNKKVATVTASGKIKAVKKGKATITIKCGKKTKKCNVVIK